MVVKLKLKDEHGCSETKLWTYDTWVLKVKGKWKEQQELESAKPRDERWGYPCLAAPLSLSLN